ncbi:transcriptional regulator [Sporanaerobium hydrogeniformans]|uniref:Transcriptional regulator n=1 Tax=Sporanaerobium hydrogeniformans TaxID=3072179 RepID=A0AC61D9Y0_9FIRM|nr:GntR family transcriptional regulator [Sporanaerobium hydrogeniformans]PHV69412.1 transcriptional regulator [Sporanaerobium hydrogeniformans]
MIEMKNNFTPRYYQLKNIIIDMIENEEIGVDECIPSEPKLMQTYNLSRTTVRKAIDELVNEGYLYKKQGKGTFVKGRGFEQGLIKLSGCSEDIRRYGLEPKPYVLRAEIEKPSKKVAKMLGISQDEEVFYMERVIYGDDIPINKNKSYIPYQFFKGIEKIDFSQESLYKVLEKDYGAVIKRAIRTVEAILASEEIALQLKIKEGAPVMLFKGQVYAQMQGKEAIIEYFEAIYRSDQFQFYIEQHR